MQSQKLLKSELFSSSKYADVACLSGPIRQATAIPVMWPPTALQQIKALAPCRTSAQASCSPKWFLLSSHPCMLKFWWPLCPGRK